MMDDTPLTEPPSGLTRTFLDLPFGGGSDGLVADVALLGIPYGMPYSMQARINDQCLAPDALRRHGIFDSSYTLTHYDWDLGGPLLDGRPVRLVDCGNVTAEMSDPKIHYQRAEAAVRKILKAGATPIVIGGDHGIPIPVMRALDATGHDKITLVHIDAHLDWRDEVNGEHDGYSSPIRRASELPWIDKIIQIGMRGIGSARQQEIDDARAYGADLITAYEMHAMGIPAVLDRIPDGGPYYLTIDADGLDPTIMPGVLAPTPGGLTWLQTYDLIHGLVNKGRVLGMDLVEMTPSYDVGKLTMAHAERLVCNFIGATVRAGYYDKR